MDDDYNFCETCGEELIPGIDYCTAECREVFENGLLELADQIEDAA